MNHSSLSPNQSYTIAKLSESFLTPTTWNHHIQARWNSTAIISPQPKKSITSDLVSSATATATSTTTLTTTTWVCEFTVCFFIRGWLRPTSHKVWPCQAILHYGSHCLLSSLPWHFVLEVPPLHLRQLCPSLPQYKTNIPSVSVSFLCVMCVCVCACFFFCFLLCF